MDLAKGGNTALPDGPVTVRVTTGRTGADQDVDVTAYLLGASGKVARDADMVFYNQPASPDGSLRLSLGADGAAFSFDPARAPAAVARIAIAAVVGGSVPRIPPATTVSIEGEGFRAAFAAGAEAGSEKALILVELYRRDAGWKVRAVAQGFDGGLKPLSEHFGVVVDADVAPASTPGATPPPAPTRTVSLSKVTLDKERPRIDLTKGAAGFGEVSINLNWNKIPARTGGRGILSRPVQAKPIDLDLACLYELDDGHKGAVQALGKAFGSYDEPPFVVLSGDDRTGAVAEGEWLRVNGARWPRVRRLLVYTFIYEGVPDWSATDAVVTVHTPGQPVVEVQVTGDGSRHNLCAIALIENHEGDIRVSREVRYFPSAVEMDQAHGWGIRWGYGRKD